MLVDTSHPELRAGGCVESVHVRTGIAEVDRVSRSASARTEDRRVADAAPGREGPYDAAALGVERVHHAVLAADKQPAAGDRWLRPRGRGVRKSECPLQFELRDILLRQT